MARNIQVVDLPVSSSRQLKSYTSGTAKEVFGFRSDKHAEKVLGWHDRSLLRSYEKARRTEIWSGIKIVAVLILVFSLSSLLLDTTNASVLSFQTLLEFLGSVEPVDFSSMLYLQNYMVDFDETIPFVGVVLGALETIINMSLSIVTVLSYLFTGLYNALLFILNFFGFIFTV